MKGIRVHQSLVSPKGGGLFHGFSLSICWVQRGNWYRKRKNNESNIHQDHSWNHGSLLGVLSGFGPIRSGAKENGFQNSGFIIFV
jgi:hypothetical protein